VNFVREKIGFNEVVHVVAQMGSAAFNVQGGTIHRFGGIDWKNKNKEIIDRTRERLLKKIQKAMVLLLDERSLMRKQLLGSLEENVGKKAHNLAMLTRDGEAPKLW
jgi:hypothetical protein